MPTARPLGYMDAAGTFTEVAAADLLATHLAAWSGVADSTTFLRSDGALSNTLTAGLTLGGALSAGIGGFSGLLTASAGVSVGAGSVKFSGIGVHATGNTEILADAAGGGNLKIYAPTGKTMGLYFADVLGASFSSTGLAIAGNCSVAGNIATTYINSNTAGNAGNLYLGASSDYSAPVGGSYITLIGDSKAGALFPGSALYLTGQTTTAGHLFVSPNGQIQMVANNGGVTLGNGTGQGTCFLSLGANGTPLTSSVSALIGGGNGPVLNAVAGSTSLVSLAVGGANLLTAATAGLGAYTGINFLGSGTSNTAFTQIYADGNAGNLILALPTAKCLLGQVAGANLFALGSSLGTQGNSRWGMGFYGTTGNTAGAGFAQAFGNIYFNVAAGNSHIFQVQGTTALSLNSTNLNLGAIAATFTGAGTHTTGNTEILTDAAGGNLKIYAPTGKTMGLYFADVLGATFSSSGLTLAGALNLGTATTTVGSIGIDNSNSTADPTLAGLASPVTLYPDLRFVARDLANANLIGFYLGSKLAMSMYRGNSSYSLRGPLLDATLTNWNISPLAQDSTNTIGSIILSTNQATTGAQIRIYGAQHATYPGQLQILNTGGVPLILSDRVYVGSGAIVDPGAGGIAMTGKLSCFGATITGSASTDGAVLGANQLGTTGWTSTGWSGSPGGPYTNTATNITSLTNSLAAATGTACIVSFVVTGASSGSFTITFGGVTSAAFATSGSWGPTALTTGSLSITPTASFNGTVSVSIQNVTSSSAAVLTLKSSDSATRFEARGNIAASSTYLGVSAGRFASSVAIYNTALGVSGLYRLTTGVSNTTVGAASLLSLDTGNYNTALGVLAGSVNTLLTLSNCTFLGYQATSFVDGITNSTALGNAAQVTASNQIQLGNTAITAVNTSGKIGNTNAANPVQFAIPTPVAVAAVTAAGIPGLTTTFRGCIEVQGSDGSYGRFQLPQGSTTSTLVYGSATVSGGVPASTKWGIDYSAGWRFNNQTAGAITFTLIEVLTGIA